MSTQLVKFAAFLLLLSTSVASAQSVPNGTLLQGQVWTTQQWIYAWQQKADVNSPKITGSLKINGLLVPTITGTPVAGNCVQWSSPISLSDVGFPCGSGGGGGGGAFSAITSGLNTAATMQVGTGASLTPTGSGTILATSMPAAGLTGSLLAGSFPAFTGDVTTSAGSVFSTVQGVHGAAVPTSTNVLSTNSSAQLIAATSGNVIALWSGTCNAGTYLRADGSCQSAGGGSPAFTAITAGTNTSAAMVVGTGSSLATSGSGTITASALGSLSGLPTEATQTVIGNGSGSIAAPVALTLGGNIIATATGLTTSQAINPQSGTIYAILSGDAGHLITFNNASAVAVSLSAATTTGFTAGFSIDVQNLGVGTVTITPTTSTINGAATLVIPKNAGCTITSDGTNYQISACPAASSATFGSITSGTNTIGTMTVGTGGSITTSGTGVNNANQINGVIVPATAAVLASNGSSQLTALTLGNNLTISGGVLNPSQIINAQSGTTYAMLSSDAGKLVTFNNAASIAVSLSQATTAGFGTGFSFDVQNIGVGVVTITPAVSTIDGVATLVILQNQGCTVTSDGTNYQVSLCTAVLGNNLTQAANTSTDGFTLIDSTAATVGNQQFSPRIRLTGQGWKTTATAASQPVDWIFENQPVQGATNPSTNLMVNYQINGGGYVNQIIVSSGSAGGFNFNGTGNAIFGGPVMASSLRVNGTSFNSPVGTGLYAPVTGTAPTTLGFDVASTAVGSWTTTAFTPLTPIISAGTAFTVASGTGACATSSTILGGAVVGSFVCTGTTGASTATLTLVAAPHAYACHGRDVTTPTTLTQTGAVSTTSVTLTMTSVTANDVIQFACLGY